MFYCFRCDHLIYEYKKNVHNYAIGSCDVECAFSAIGLSDTGNRHGEAGVDKPLFLVGIFKYRTRS